MFDVIDPSSIRRRRAPYKLDQYEALILGDKSNLNSDLVDKIDNYIKNDGKVLTTGLSLLKDIKEIPERNEGLGYLGIEPDYEFFPQTQSTN